MYVRRIAGIKYLYHSGYLIVPKVARMVAKSLTSLFVDKSVDQIYLTCTVPVLSSSEMDKQALPLSLTGLIEIGTF